MNTDFSHNMKARIATYLKVMGIIQLASLNLGGIFWLEWAYGVRAGKQSSRRWVIGVHAVYLAACLWLLAQWFLGSMDLSHLRVFGHRLEVGRLAILVFILVLMLIYGLPVAWLMSKNVKREFVESGAPPSGGPATQPGSSEVGGGPSSVISN